MIQLGTEQLEGAGAAVEHGSGFRHRGLAIVAAWILVAMLLAAQAWFAAQVRGESLAFARAGGIWLVWAAVWAGLTPIALWIEARFPLRRPRWPLALAVHALASAACALANLALFALAAPLIGATQVEPTWLGTFSRLLGTTFLLNLPVYGHRKFNRPFRPVCEVAGGGARCREDGGWASLPSFSPGLGGFIAPFRAVCRRRAERGPAGCCPH